MSHQVEIQLTEFVTHDVKRFILNKPEGKWPGLYDNRRVDKSGLGGVGGFAGLARLREVDGP